MKLKLLLILGPTLLVLAALAAFAFRRMMEQPLYRPGLLAQEAQQDTSPESAEPKFAPDGSLTVAPGIQLHTFRRGEGQGPPVIVVHGGPGIAPARSWKGLDAMGARHAFLYYHQRGCGQSTRPFDTVPEGNPFARMKALHQTLGFPAQIGDLEQLRRAIGEEQVILLGHSFGALLATLYAAEYPEHVRGLVLVSPAPLLRMPAPKGEPDLIGAVRERLSPAAQLDYDEFLGRYFDFKGNLDRTESEVAALNDAFGAYYAEAAAASGFTLPRDMSEASGGFVVPALYLGLGRRHDWTGLVTGVTAPVLIVHGALDLQTESASRRFLEEFPNARFAVIDEAGHFPFESQPEAFAAVVEPFLDDL